MKEQELELKILDAIKMIVSSTDAKVEYNTREYPESVNLLGSAKANSPMVKEITIKLRHL